MAAEASVLRRTATGVFAFGFVVFLAAVYVALVYWENTVGLGASQVTRMSLVDWVVLFSVLLVLVLVALLILYFIPGAESDEAPVVDEWHAAEPLEEAEPVTYADAQPLPMEEAPPMEFAEPLEQEAITEALLVRCTNCQTEFELPYTTERPLQGTCPSCQEEFVLEEGEDVLAQEGQDVLEIEGIGPKFAKKLREAGVATTGQLRAASVERLAEQTGIDESLLSTWRSMADLLRVEGVDTQYAELLARAGVYSVDELARESPSRLNRRLKQYLDTLERKPTEKPVSEKRCEGWIRAAQSLKSH